MLGSRLRAPRACLLKIWGLVRDHDYMVRGGVIGDGLWAVLEPVVPARARRRGRPWNDHRRTLEGIAWRFRTGSPWRDVPAEFGAWQSLWERHYRWSGDGTYDRMLAAVRAAGSAEDEELLETISVDSSSARAHQHAAGAPRPHPGTGG